MLFFLFMNHSKIACAQDEPEVRAAFDKLAKAYHSNSITTEQYLAKADSVVHQFYSEGKHFETKELVDLLHLYEKIAWSNPKHGDGRISYFYLFFNNARMFKQRGASMYYAEKITEEYKKNGEEHPLIEQLQKCKIYQELRLYDKVVEVFNSEKSFLTHLPELLKQDQVDNSVGLNAMYILSPVITGYTKMNDTAGVYQIAHLAKQIGSTLQYKGSLTRSQMLYNDLLMIDIAHSLANFEHKYDSARILLNRMEALKTTYKDQVTNFIDLNLIRLRIESYLNLENQDSLRSYIEKYRSSPAFGNSQKADLAEFSGKLQALEGNYKGAYASLSGALELERNVQSAVMAESSDLLYAYTQAEHNGIALQDTERVKQQRTLWLIVVSFSASIIVLVIYLTMLRRNKKAKKQVEILNDAANMQIIALEEAKHQAVKEEQRRLGQDLHDGLSSSIASIRHQLEMISMDTRNHAVKEKLDNLQTEVARAYAVARNKSHEWFSASEEQDEQSFEKRIKLLTDIALPDSRYHKEIHIDDRALLHVNTDTRIALLRIIQEAITNVIKYAKAKNVGILIYEEKDSLILAVKDDGKGLDEKQLSNDKSTMGLRSIRRRVEYLNGDMTIHSDTKGTEIVASIPLISS